jgi:hypothetical protein
VYGYYPYTRLGMAGDISPHAATADDNPAGASRTDTEIEKRPAGPFYRRLCRRQRDREKAERLLSIGAVIESGREMVKKKSAILTKGRAARGIGAHLSTKISGRTSRSAGSSSGTHLS